MFASFAYYFKSGTSIQSTVLPTCCLLGCPVRSYWTPQPTMTFSIRCSRAGVYIATIPPNVRDYSNVTLHVARTASGLGKTVSDETKALRLPRLATRLSEEIAPGRSVFLCVHKHSEALAETFSTDSLKLSVGHWGAIDGKNTGRTVTSLSSSGCPTWTSAAPSTTCLPLVARRTPRGCKRTPTSSSHSGQCDHAAAPVNFGGTGNQSHLLPARN